MILWALSYAYVTFGALPAATDLLEQQESIVEERLGCKCAHGVVDSTERTRARSMVSGAPGCVGAAAGVVVAQPAPCQVPMRERTRVTWRA